MAFMPTLGGQPNPVDGSSPKKGGGYKKGLFLATGGADFDVRLWDLSTCTVSHVFEGHVNSITALTFALSGMAPPTEHR
jgi:WD40 repeat protein